MKYLKLFEKFIEEPLFFRFNKFDLLGDKDEIQFFPKERSMFGPEIVNQALVNRGFPDKHRCVHFMDSLAFNPSYRGLYGNFIYQIKIDDESQLGWSFLIPVNDWFYRGHPFYQERNNPVIQDLLKSEYSNLYFPFDDENEIEIIEKMADYLLEYGVIGTGTIEDLKKSKLFGKQKVFVWTNDSVIVGKWTKPSKPPTPYKNKPLLNKEDFESLQIDSSEIGKFYQSDFGRNIKRLQDRLIENPSKFDLFREEALNQLKNWKSTL